MDKNYPSFNLELPFYLYYCNVLKNLKENFLKFLTLQFIFLLLLVGIRLFEQFVLHFYQSLNFNTFKFIGYGINFDSLFVLSSCLFLLVPYLLITFLKPRAALIFLRTILFILLFIHIGLTQFFFTTLTLLDDSLFYFSLSEVKHIIGNEAGNFHWYTWIMLLLFLGMGVWLLLIKRVWYFTNRKVQIACFALFPVLMFVTIKNLKTINPSQ